MILKSLSALLVAGVAISSLHGSNLSQYVDKDGNIDLPKDFRKNMSHLGSWYVPEGPASGFHDVYTEKKSVEAYRKTGKFPDGATIVKELRSSKAGNYTTGSGVSYPTKELKQWFVMIKDSKNRFEKTNKIWGDGWGWALFKPNDRSKNIAKDYKVDCLGCHIPAKKNDLLYTEAYPTLSEMY